MWRLIAVVVLAIREVQAQNTSNGTAECPNVPGFFYQGSCELLCRETKWTDVVVFYLGNYIAHAATITTRPGQSTLITVVTMIGAVLLPGTGIWNGLKAILSLARFAPTDLQTAARAGALYAVVKDNHHRPYLTSVSDGAEGIQMAAMPATMAARSTQQDQNIEKQLLEDSSVHEDSRQSNGTANCLLNSNIHGLCDLPEGYHLMQIPQNATFVGEDDLPIDHRPWYHYRRLANTIFPWTQPQPAKSTTALSCSYNIVRVLASIIQLIFAVSTLYRTRGDQLQRYGYAAFGLTVIPFAWMSLINLVGNAMCPQYDKIYIVSSRALRDLEHTRRDGCQNLDTSEQDQWQVDGTVGRLEDHWEEQLCKDYALCHEQEGAEQTTLMARKRSALNAVLTTWSRKSLSGMILGPIIDILWTEDFRRTLRWYRDEFVLLAREVREDPKSGIVSFCRRWKEQLLAPLVVFIVPLALVGGLSGFQPGQSEPFQRVWVMMWLVLGLGVGFVLGQALRRFGNQSANVYQQPTGYYVGPYGFLSFWEAIMGAMAYGPVAIGGYVVVTRMLLESGSCVEVKTQSMQGFFIEK
ncbi:nacht domain protein [Colletotrichum chrysophilum]|uniref:Nacht domain protein n=1 Tax=Colletotrichum chrysophilum TaxID=1836956 RepID=A0AAD9AJF7_9PEZI|nr:nacht domain protein [Colletotrichum chrysophilum]